MADFLFELGCEELPPHYVRKFHQETPARLQKLGTEKNFAWQSLAVYATPRRLSLSLLGILQQESSEPLYKRGPALNIALDETGRPTKAGLGFAKSCGVAFAELEQLKTEHGAWLIYYLPKKEIDVAHLLVESVFAILKQIMPDKTMRWGEGNYQFVRPVRWLVLTYHNELISYEFCGIQSQLNSFGHRFHHPQSLMVNVRHYQSQLMRAFVVADYDERLKLITQQINQLAEQHQATAIAPQSLLAEVTALVEWPEVLLGKFADSFLKLPEVVLLAAMQTHQKCFALRAQSGKLLPVFIIIANIKSNHPSQLVNGNERVMQARLEDAQFFWQQDLKKPLDAYYAALKPVIVQQALGTMHEQVQRLNSTLLLLADEFGLEHELILRAAHLSRCDLVTTMVGEFPNLAGHMGYHYALQQGEDPLVARALLEQYDPINNEDCLPESDYGWALAVANRLDPLVGLFLAGLTPSGSLDPFKLRRHALALVRLLSTKKLSFSLAALLKNVAASFSPKKTHENQLKALELFIMGRAKAYYQQQGVTSLPLKAIFSNDNDTLFTQARKVSALIEFLKFTAT